MTYVTFPACAPERDELVYRTGDITDALVQIRKYHPAYLPVVLASIPDDLGTALRVFGMSPCVFVEPEVLDG